MTTTYRDTKGTGLSNAQIDSNWRSTATRYGGVIASASTLSLTNEYNYFHVSGTTTVTGITSQAYSDGAFGFEVKLVFDDILTLTHNAAALVLPSGANITTAAGDVVTFVQKTAAIWECTSYTRADGSALDSGTKGWHTLDTFTTTSGTSFSNTTIPATTTHLKIVFNTCGTDGSSNTNSVPSVQLGDSSGYSTTSGIQVRSQYSTSTHANSIQTGGYCPIAILHASSVYAYSGILEMSLGAGNVWSVSGTFSNVQGGTTTGTAWTSGTMSLSGELDRIQLTTIVGTDSFNSGSCRVYYYVP